MIPARRLFSGQRCFSLSWKRGNSGQDAAAGLSADAEQASADEYGRVALRPPHQAAIGVGVVEGEGNPRPVDQRSEQRL
ncbi:MAG: hypothetical protein ABIG63_21800 [Chloroflexota bacterium]